MNDEQYPTDGSLLFAVLRRLDRICVEFEAAWRRGETPRIEPYLGGVTGPERAWLLLQLLLLELDYRQRSGELPSALDYHARFPDDSAVIEEAFQLLRGQRDAALVGDTESFIPKSEQGTEDEPGRVQAVDEDKPAPDRIGRYKILAVLGKGGFGVVYLAEDTELNRRVALKAPLASRFSSSEELERFVQEARTAAQLEHPGIVPVYDVFREANRVVIVQKYVEGGDLRSHLKSGALPADRAAELTVRVAGALAFAHQKGFVHRDLKPGNILLDAEGEPHVADFGLAIHESIQRQRRGERSGTPAYMSPEQVRGETHRMDGRTDIWSLGAILYEMLTGRRPFHGEPQSELFDEIKYREPKPPSQIDPKLPAELERICLKCLSKRATDRYPNAAALTEDLRHWLSAKPEEAPPEPESRPVKIVPKGLRSFGPEDADFFLELLPGPRDRDGLPESIRFWKTRIEETDPDNTFAVGLIYGPSGCGKSSLVRAGLLPRLALHVVSICIEATPAGTEVRLLKALRRRFPQIPSDISLPELFESLRQGVWVPIGQKVLIVLDQFEQWLHARRAETETQLHEALGHCDGEHLQCLFMVRDDFWLATSRFMQALEIGLVERQNMTLVDLFDPPHARKVLTEFGRAYDCLPDNLRELTTDQEAFLDRAVEGLARDGKVICVRLALFADMVKCKPWIAATLKQVGGTEGLGVTFLEETFSTATAPAKYRYHQRAAQALLKALLPEAGTDIGGGMRSREELLQSSGCERRPKDFDNLIRILDGELRLITPTDPEGSENEEERPSNSQGGGQHYQLTHDYLVPALRDWLTRKQRETRRGRAELTLAECAALWNAKQEDRHLPSLREWHSIRLLTKARDWTTPQRRMMARADRVHSLRSLGLLVAGLLFFAITAAFFWMRAEHEEAVRQREIADATRSEAERQKGFAETQKRIAEDNAEEAEKQRKIALREKNEADAQRAIAVEQKTLAELAKEKEEYEAYIARIGVAAAKIEENAFDRAYALLDECPPRLRDWEWGRLRHLCTQDIRAYDAQQPIDAVAFSPDASRFVTGGWGGTARIWDAESGKELVTIPTGGQYVYAVAFSPDGKHVATGVDDRPDYVKIWDAQTGALIQALRGHGDAVLSVVYSRDGSRLLSGSYDNTARLWDLSTGRLIRTFEGHDWWVWSAAFCPNEKRIVTASQDGTAIVWSVETGKAGSPFLGHVGPLYTAAFAPEGQHVATGGYDKRVLLWDPDEVQPFDFDSLMSDRENSPPVYQSLDGHTAAVASIQFSPDGRLLVSGGHDNTVGVWDVSTRTLLKTLRGHGGRVRSCVFAPDGQTVLSGSHDHQAKTWSIGGYEEVRVLRGGVLRGGVLEGRVDAVVGAAFSADGKRIVTVSRDETVKTWDFESGEEVMCFNCNGAAASVQFSPDRRRIVTGSGGNAARIWNAETGLFESKLAEVDEQVVNSAVFSPDGDRVLTASDDKTAKLWDAYTGKLLRAFIGHEDKVQSAVFNANGERVLTASSDKTARIWDAETGAELQVLAGHGQAVLDAAFSPDGTRVITASEDNTARIWNAETGEPLPFTLEGHTASVTSVAFSPTGTRAVTASQDHTAKIWAAETGRELLSLKGHSEELTAAAFSPDGQTVLTSSLDGTVILWLSLDWHGAKTR